MATMISEVYDALKDAGAAEEKARAAAEAIASYENRFVAIEKQIEDVRSELKLQRWMLGFNLAISVTMLFKMFA